MRTFVAKPQEAVAQRKWWVVDAQNQPLGRVASRVATLLRGKHKVSFTPNVDTGDFVIVLNATGIKLTGKKADQKLYRRHSGYPGGLVETQARRMRETRPHVMVEEAIKGMLPKTKLGKQMYRKLKVYAGDRHPHQAQKPVEMTVR